MNRIPLALLVFLLLSACGRPGGTGGNGSDGGTGGGTQIGQNGLTWYRDVLPITQRSCQGCHAAGGIAPFPLETYANAAAYHLSMAASVASRSMPPWMPDDTCISLQHSRRLSDAEIATITQWSEQGAAEGNPADAPTTPPPPTGLPRVDDALDPGFDYTPQGTANYPYDDYHCFVLPPAFTATTDVIGMDIAPGTRTQVHHVILFAMPSSSATQKDPTGLGWTCYGGTGVTGSRMVGGWVPGSGAAVFPADTGIRLNNGDVLVMQVHYNLINGAPIADRTQARLMYATTSVPKPATLFPITTQNFTIQPYSTGTTATARFTMPGFLSSTIYGVTPHMHQLGRSIRAQNTTTGQCLIDVPWWDFHWQQPYEYWQPVTLGPSQTVEVQCVWDNPTANTVTFGEGTSDEMCMAFFYTTTP